MPLEIETLKRIFSSTNEPSLELLLAGQVMLINTGHADEMSEVEEDRLFEAELENIRDLKAKAEGSPVYR